MPSVPVTKIGYAVAALTTKLIDTAIHQPSNHAILTD
jgi:hypothetical protein